MAEVSGGAVRLIDKDGDPLDDGEGRLNINATLEAATVNIGDVDILSVPAPLNVTGGGTESSALRVTIANDSTGVLTVDGTVAEDSASSSGEKGIHVIAVRRDQPTSGVGADGDYASLSVDYSGGLYTRELSTYDLDSFAMIDVDNAVEDLEDAYGANCHEIFLQADEDNSGYVMVGDADVADNRGMKLNPGDTIILNMNDTRGVYLWGSAADQNIRCIIKTRTT